MREDIIVGRIDGKRSREADTARKANLRELGRSAVNAAVLEVRAEDRAEFLRGAIDQSHRLYGQTEGDTACASLFAAKAKQGPVSVGQALSSAVRSVWPE